MGDKVFLKISPWKGVLRFGKRGKLSPRYIGLFEVIERIGPVAYRLVLLLELSQIHDVFHITMLRRYKSDPSHILQAQPLEIKDNLSYEERPVVILAKEVKELRKKTLVKVLWKHHGNEEATWEWEEDIRNQSPNLYCMTRRANLDLIDPLPEPDRSLRQLRKRLNIEKEEIQMVDAVAGGSLRSKTPEQA
eukprot:XP_015572615.1 uncharacterized protein LOC107260950 [Ricinus communis]